MESGLGQVCVSVLHVESTKVRSLLVAAFRPATIVVNVWIYERTLARTLV